MSKNGLLYAPGPAYALPTNGENMTNKIDASASLPTQSPDAGIGDALFNAMNGGETPTQVQTEQHVQEVFKETTSDLEKLMAEDATKEDNTTASEASQAETEEKAPEPTGEDEVETVEFKVKGFKEPVKIPKNWEDPKVQEYINKGIRFDKRMAELARSQKEVEEKLAQVSDYADKADLADKVSAARALMEAGHSEAALQSLLGESTEDMLNSLVEERIKYQNASPEERLKMDLDRKERQRSLREKQDADRIAKLEAQINARSEQVREAEYSGYIEDAKSRYDISQWVQDADEAASLNEMVDAAAMKAIVNLQRKREAEGRENITQRDIRREYATRVKRVLNGLERQSSKNAEEVVSKQAEVAKQNAQVASTKNYQSADPFKEWQKSGQSMTDLLDLIGRGGKI